MSNYPYSVLGPNVAPMLGRMKFLQKALDMLNKPTPDHISIVGPKYYGKTVFLNELSTQITQQDNKYVASVLIDLKHGTPQTDHEFLMAVAGAIKAKLDSNREGLVSVLNDDDPKILPDGLEYVFDELQKKQEKLLLICDGFDPLPIGTTITPNLLDRLRSYAQLPSVRFVISSRKRLRDLCKTQESRTSDFWRIFSEPLRMGCFEQDDSNDCWLPFEEQSITVEQGARTELLNWTSGIPVLVAIVLKELGITLDAKQISNSDVVKICERLSGNPFDIIEDLWDDLTNDQQRLVVDANSGQLKESQAHREALNELKFRGIVKPEAGNVKSCNRFMFELSQQKATSLADMNRLFGDEQNFQANVRRMIELRLEQVGGVDEQAYRTIHNAVQDLGENPRRVLDATRGILEDILDIAFKMENLAGGSSFPKKWKEYWKDDCGQDMPVDLDPIPVDRGAKCRLIRFITGREKQYLKVPSKLSRQSSWLLDQLSSYGNMSNHIAGEQIDFGSGYLMCLTAIELLVSLERDKMND